MTKEINSTELRNLKRDWASDPCWDIENTEGFEDYRDELLVYRLEMEAEWTRKYQSRLEAKAEELGVPGNIKLAQYIMSLESQIEKLFEKLDSFE